MSVAMTNCGARGWVSDRTGYRYETLDPDTGRPWPPLPDHFLRLARDAAAQAGFADFLPDACLINRYEPDARLSLHQGPGRARPERAHRVGLPRPAGGVSARGPATPGPDPPPPAGAWRRAGVGWSRPVAVSRRATAQSWAPSRAGESAAQSDVPPGRVRNGGERYHAGMAEGPAGWASRGASCRSQVRAGLPATGPNPTRRCFFAGRRCPA